VSPGAPPSRITGSPGSRPPRGRDPRRLPLWTTVSPVAPNRGSARGAVRRAPGRAAPHRLSRIGLRRAALALLLLPTAAVVGACAAGDAPSGAEIYRAQCARCHGAEGKGDPRSVGLYPALDLTASRLVRAGSAARGAIYLRIAEGYDAMPGFSAKLDTPAIEALIDYILRLPQGKASG
jgi:mono/diheme cytochrome c family protein